MLYLADFRAPTINKLKELKENIVSMKKLIGNLNRKMKVLKMQKENSKAEKYNKTYTKWTVNSRV